MSPRLHPYGLHDERGIALALAVFGLAVIGALVGTTFLAGRLEQESGRNTLFAAQAREAAEAGVNEAIAHVEASSLEGLAIGALLDLGAVPVGPGASATRQVVRLTGSLFLIRSRATRQSAGGTILAACSVGALVSVAGETTVAAGPVGAPTNGVRVIERGWAQLY